MPGFAAATARTGRHRRLRLRHHRGHRRAVPRGRHHRRTASSTARSPRARDRIVADGRTFSYVLHRGDVPMKITQNDVRAIQLAKAALYAGVALLMDHLGVDQRRPHRARRRLRQPHRHEARDGARHDPGLRPRPGRPRSATPPAPGRGSRCSTPRPAPPSRTSCAGSRRSRPRSSRASRRISSRRWRSRTRPRPILSCARS